MNRFCHSREIMTALATISIEGLSAMISIESLAEKTRRNP
jgi:hypothetical protein